MFQGLRTVIYHVDDLQKAKQWYSSILGIKPYFDEQFYVGFNMGGYELGLDPNMQGLQGQQQCCRLLGSQGCPGCVSEGKGARRKEAFRAADVGGGIIVATVTDPFGNVFGIIENPQFKVDGGE